jgi:hypothetical protein
MNLTLETLAQNFGDQLRKELPLSELLEVIELNTSKPNPCICHSHDFTDANEVMNEAWLLTYPDTPFDLHNDAHCQHWTAAWSLAKQQQFGVHFLPLRTGSADILSAPVRLPASSLSAT